MCVASVNNVGTLDEVRPSQDCYIFCSLGLGRQRSPTVVGFYWVLSLFVLKVAVHRGGSGTWIQDFGLRSDFVYVGHVGGVASVEDFLSSVEGSECLWLVLCGGYLLMQLCLEGILDLPFGSFVGLALSGRFTTHVVGFVGQEDFFVFFCISSVLHEEMWWSVRNVPDLGGQLDCILRDLQCLAVYLGCRVCMVWTVPRSLCQVGWSR